MLEIEKKLFGSLDKAMNAWSLPPAGLPKTPTVEDMGYEVLEEIKKFAMAFAQFYAFDERWKQGVPTEEIFDKFVKLMRAKEERRCSEKPGNVPESQAGIPV